MFALYDKLFCPQIFTEIWLLIGFRNVIIKFFAIFTWNLTQRVIWRVSHFTDSINQRKNIFVARFSLHEKTKIIDFFFYFEYKKCIIICKCNQKLLNFADIICRSCRLNEKKVQYFKWTWIYFISDVRCRHPHYVMFNAFKQFNGACF